MKLGMVFTLLGTCLFGFNQEALEKIVADYTSAWNEEACHGFGANFSENASFVNIFGKRFDGKQAIEDRHVEILQTFLKDSKLIIDKTDFSEIAPGVVVGHVSWTVQGFRRPCCGPDALGQELRGTYTQVFVEKDGVWEIVSSQNTAEPMRKCG